MLKKLKMHALQQLLNKKITFKLKVNNSFATFFFKFDILSIFTQSNLILDFKCYLSIWFVFDEWVNFFVCKKLFTS